MHQNFTQANIINDGQSILEVERYLSPIIGSLRQKPHVQEGNRFSSPQLLILLHAHTKTLITASTSVPYVRMKLPEIPGSGLARLAGLYFI